MTGLLHRLFNCGYPYVLAYIMFHKKGPLTNVAQEMIRCSDGCVMWNACRKCVVTFSYNSNAATKVLLVWVSWMVWNFLFTLEEDEMKRWYLYHWAAFFRRVESWPARKLQCQKRWNLLCCRNLESSRQAYLNTRECRHVMSLKSCTIVSHVLIL